jgi:hypothetical protein
VNRVSISDEIRASAGAHRDLGPAYDTAVAEGLVERIGAEIDKRIDARLYGHPPVQPQPPMAPPPAPRPVQPRNRIGAGAVILAFGSMALGIGATGVVLHPGGGNHTDPSAPLVALIWIMIGVINVVYARRR